MAVPLKDNWFAAGAAILTQIKAQCPQFVKVSDAPSLDALGKVLTGITPSAYVIPGPFAGGEANPRQTWYVAVHVRNVAQIAEGSGLLLEAGALLSAVLAALAQFVPGPEFSPLFFPTEDHRYPDVGQGVYILTYATYIEPDFWPYYR
jgi:hypothetical protein